MNQFHSLHCLTKQNVQKNVIFWTKIALKWNKWTLTISVIETTCFCCKSYVKICMRYVVRSMLHSQTLKQRDFNTILTEKTGGRRCSHCVSLSAHVVSGVASDRNNDAVAVFSVSSKERSWPAGKNLSTWSPLDLYLHIWSFAAFSPIK